MLRQQTTVNPSSAIQQIPTVVPTTPTPNGSEPLIVTDPEDQDRHCYESEGFFKFQYTVDDLLLAASTAATVFNVLVIFCGFKLFKRNGDTMHIFIINMTLGDLLLTVFCHPNEFLIRKHAFLRHVRLCAIIHYCNWLGLAISGLSLTLLNVDKLIYFHWPFSYERTMSKRRAIFLCFSVWAVSLGFVTYVWMNNIVYVTPDNCMLQMAHHKKYFYEIFMIMFCVLPVTSSLVVSTYLFRLARQKRNAPVPISPNNNLDVPTFKNKMKSLVFIFATTVWTSFSLLPYRIFNICRIHFFDWTSISCEQRNLMNWGAWMLIYLLTLNPVINPLITSIIYAPYRATLKKLLISIPIGNRLQYSTYETENRLFSFSYFSSVRRTPYSRRKSKVRKVKSNPSSSTKSKPSPILALGDFRSSNSQNNHSKNAAAKVSGGEAASNDPLLQMNAIITPCSVNLSADETNSSTSTSSSIFKLTDSERRRAMEEEGEGSPKSLLEKKLMIMGRGNEEVVTAQPAPTQGVVTFKDDLLEGHLMRRESSSSSSSSRRQQNPA